MYDGILVFDYNFFLGFAVHLPINKVPSTIMLFIMLFFFTETIKNKRTKKKI